MRAMDKHPFETIVIGLGAMGSAATYQLAKRGNHILGIDRFSSPHFYGSSHGDTRVTRQALGEVLAQLATQGRSDIDIRPFSLKRFAKA